MTETSAPSIVLEPWYGPWPDDDPDANFKNEVALFNRLDPLSTITNLSQALDIPVGAVCRYVLAKWASAGAEALLAVGPSGLERMWGAVEAAEADGTTEARLEAYEQLRSQISWLKTGLDDPEAYPGG